MEIKAAIEKNSPFCAGLFVMWARITNGELNAVAFGRARIHGASLWAAYGSEEWEELTFLRDLLSYQCDVYEIKEKQEAA